jgi:hypothetical protein
MNFLWWFTMPMQEGPMLVKYSEAAMIFTWVRKVPSADNFTLTLTEGCIVVSIVYRNYQVFKDLFKITQVEAIMQSSYQNIILDDCNIFLYSRTNISKDVQIEI